MRGFFRTVLLFFLMIGHLGCGNSSNSSNDSSGCESFTFNGEDVSISCGKVDLTKGGSVFGLSGSGGVNHYFLKFQGPVTKKQRDQLEDSGAKIVGHAGPHTFIIQASAPISNAARYEKGFGKVKSLVKGLMAGNSLGKERSLMSQEISRIKNVGGSAPFLPKYKKAQGIKAEDRDFIVKLFQPITIVRSNPDPTLIEEVEEVVLSLGGKVKNVFGKSIQIGLKNQSGLDEIAKKKAKKVPVIDRLIIERPVVSPTD